MSSIAIPAVDLLFQTPVVIHPDGRVEAYRVPDSKGFQLEELQKIVGGFVEVIRLSESTIMVCNEEFLFGPFEDNKKASDIMILAGRASADGRHPEEPDRAAICGSVLVCRDWAVK